MMKHPLWLVPFRPFFMLTCLAGLVLPLAWVLVYSGAVLPAPTFGLVTSCMPPFPAEFAPMCHGQQFPKTIQEYDVQHTRVHTGRSYKRQPVAVMSLRAFPEEGVQLLDTLKASAPNLHYFDSIAALEAYIDSF